MEIVLCVNFLNAAVKYAENKHKNGCLFCKWRFDFSENTPHI